MFIRGKYQSSLNTDIAKEYNNLLFVLASIKPHDRMIKAIDGTGGKVSVADLVAYQIGWGNLLIGWYETGLTGKMPQMPGEGFTTWDYTGLAQHFYKKYQYDSSSKQEQEFHAIVTKIIAIVEHEHQTKNLDTLGAWPWCTLASGKQWSLRKIVTVNTVAPYKRATALIRKLVK